MTEKIEIGDRVNVFFDRVDGEFNALVLGYPAGPGDCWRLKRLDDTVVQVQTYAKMVRVKGRVEGELAAGALASIHASLEVGVLNGPGVGMEPGFPEVIDKTPFPKPPEPPIDKSEESPFKK